MNTTDLLPPLPTPDLGMPWRVNAPDGSAHSAGYTADQMQAYAAQAVETVRSQLAHWKVFAEHAEGERSRLRGEQAVLVRLLLEADKVVSTIEGECQEEWDMLLQLRRCITAATMPHRPEEADLLSIRERLGC